MNKFTFRLPDRLKLTVAKEDSVSLMVFSAKDTSTFEINKVMLDDLFACKSCNGSIDLQPPREHKISGSTYHLSFIDCDTDGVLITLCKQNEKRVRNLHKCYMSHRDYKKFMKVCKEVYLN